MRLDGHYADDEAEWVPCRAGLVLTAGPRCEFFIPAEDVLSQTADLLRATVEGLVCSFDLRRYGLATIVDDGRFFTIAQQGRSLSARHAPFGSDDFPR